MKQFGRGKKGNWLRKHVADQFVKKSKSSGYRSRASFKLLEIDKKDNLFQQGMSVVDLGAAPGSWSQVAAEKIGPNGRLIALDLLPVQPIPNTKIIQGDFTDKDIQEELRDTIGSKKVDLIISDMAPNLTGISITDQAASVELAEIALNFAVNHLRKDGNFLIKVFHGSQFNDYKRLLTSYFKEVVTRKPAASRDCSRETYLLGLKYKGEMN